MTFTQVKKREENRRASKEFAYGIWGKSEASAFSNGRLVIWINLSNPDS